MSVQRILFVCMGNTCRSPMAEALVNARFGDRYWAESAGWSVSRSECSVHARQLTLERTGLNMDHQPRAIQQLDTSVYSAILVLDKAVFKNMQNAGYPGIMLLAVHDPFGQELFVYQNTAEEILRLFTAWDLSRQNASHVF
jgi:protein-tyrosine-phosphatase